MADHPIRALDHIRQDLEEWTAALKDLLLSPDLEMETIMSLVDDINALGVRIDAVTALLPTDVATAVAAQKATDDAANAANVQELADAQAAVTALAAKVTALETAAGVPATAPTTSPVTVSPASIASPVGTALATVLVASGGTPPYTSVSSLADVSVDALGNVTGTPAAAETGTITVSDSATPPNTAVVPVTIS